jgi:hypothetical protein
MAIRKSRSAESPRITPGKAKNAIAVARVVAAAVLPVITPYLTQTAGTVRDRWDRHRARQLGVGVDELASYSGRGGALHARIAGAADSLTELPDRAFAEPAMTRLAQLTAAIRAAERMPSARRRSAHQAVGTELDRIERDILDRLGV